MAKKTTTATEADAEQSPKRGPGRPPGSGKKANAGGGENYCTDEMRRSAYREALILKIAVESAQEVAKSKLGAYRAYLKEAGKQGVSTEAITNAIAKRMDDPELVIIEEREKLKMLELSGFLPGIMEKLMDRYSVQEPTRAEEEENHVLIAYDRGVIAGRKGHERDGNPYAPGTLGHVKWLEGYNAGQRIIADEMADLPHVDLSATQPAPRAEQVSEDPEPTDNVTPISQSAKAAAKAAGLRGDGMPGSMPSVVH